MRTDRLTRYSTPQIELLLLSLLSWVEHSQQTEMAARLALQAVFECFFTRYAWHESTRLVSFVNAHFLNVIVRKGIKRVCAAGDGQTAAVDDRLRMHIRLLCTYLDACVAPDEYVELNNSV